MVRLKVNFSEETILKAVFQFLMVRLKVSACTCSLLTTAFQFLMVRLKAAEGAQYDDAK